VGEARKVLAVDVGGSHVKLLAAGARGPRRLDSQPGLTPAEMVEQVLERAGGWRCDAVTLGVPTPVVGGRIVVDPVNLGSGWVGFDYAAAFGRPTRVVNDAVMQAIGSWEGGTMLFLGLGTGLGSALVREGRVEALELGHMPFRDRTFEEAIGKEGLERLGEDAWRGAVFEAVERLRYALEPDEVVIGGGAVEQLDELPPGARRGGNEKAFEGGFRLWRSEWAGI
jgi:polyphosphate glucokinase